MVMDASYTATFTFLLFMFLPLSNTGAQTQSQLLERIAPGSSLSPGSSDYKSMWFSPSGQFAFGFYSQGNNGFAIGIWLVGKNKMNNTIVWTANRDDPPVTSTVKLQFTMKGTIILTDQQGQQKLIVNANTRASSASMLDSGNFVLYDNHNISSIIWQSFDHPTDTLLESQSLPCGGQLSSSLSETNHSTGRFQLNMQVDGNLVLYPAYTTKTGWDSYWTSDTVSANVKHHLYLNSTGLLQIWNDSSDSSRITTLRNTEEDQQNTGNQTIYRATLDFDGVFRLYAYHVNNGSNIIMGSWPGKNPCYVKGFCGYNSFCTFDDDKPVCNCLPGYKLIDANEDTLGCERNYSTSECRGDKYGVAFYNMVPMTNLVWNDHPYFKDDDMSSEEECLFACLIDCNCWAAIYEEGRCKKQGLPLRYVKRTHEADDFTTAFLKVGNNSIQSSKGYERPFAYPIKTTSNKAIVHIIVVTSLFSIMSCSTIVISIHYMYKIRVLKYKRLTETVNFGGQNADLALRRFTYNELRRATNNFKEELGKGAFGKVYKGALNKGKRLIAVKRLEKVVEDGEREFQAEVRSIGKTHHRNLVRLLGFCHEGSKRLLVYEYMSNGSLEKLLFGDQRRPDWDERVRMALDIARGISYLHEECEAPIIHCDIKPQNILMDEFWTAKISDFGLAKLLMPDQTRTFTVVRGTRGYMAPEWNMNVPISLKADVYSYGIMLFEILCCRRNLDVNVLEPEEILLSGWAYKCLVAGQVNNLVPWEVIDNNVMENMVKVALWCIQDDPFLRPTMKGVVLMLEGVTDIAIPPCPDSGYA
ncbi:G-type lectin S-receptor-like serine/threonine-protein kinase LECRK1 [Medicago truncatula]|uniref:Receptor-like serine/threonine-protein kinase n=1 Tax=Medicago truncatula TaxID=3880 RepID=A0A0C3X5I3_MEDTR|nr:G-type lectin S-receptor-like serine/threonine-protein kinase LECRK1 [Medicago truncatula]AES91505.2 S-locus lectin kinase family protein [Medicago truncatula]